VPITFRRRTTWGCGVVALLATFSLGATSMASADVTRSLPIAEAARAAVQPGNASMGWRSRSPERSLGTFASASRAAAMTGVLGIDVSGWQRTVNWSAWKARGTSFAYIKATEGTTFRNPYFAAQYGGAYGVGMIRGAYHFAVPNGAGGKAQAKYFVAHGGGWTKDGRTLPGVLDIEYNPYGSTCYGKSKKKMVSWIKAFTKQYKKSTGRDAVIYTTLDWWKRCTGNSKSFNKTNPLWVARYARSVGTLPGGWNYYTFWQYSSKPLDQDRFSANHSRLVALANG
jgi:GH25 family lysozyme M1 (1,4-beta-N-acetylmuramidase)